MASEGDDGEEGRRVAIVACSEAAPVLETTDHDLDAVAAFVPALVVVAGLLRDFRPGMQKLDALLLQGISEPVDIPAKKGRRSPALHNRRKYRLCNQIERLFSKLKNWRRVATRYDKSKSSYLGFASLASALLWPPFVHQT